VALQIFNSIAIFDVYIIAESPEEARTALIDLIRDKADPIDPSEQTAREARNEREIRASQRDKKPFVGPLVSDADFEKIKGKTVFEMFNQLYTKTVKEKK
jgi:hypothetical protein